MTGPNRGPEQRPIDLGLPSGTLWAPCNILAGRDGGFAPSDLSLEMSYFSWGNSDGHNIISGSTLDYDFGNSNEGVYSSTPGSDVSFPNMWPENLDPAYYYCGGRWRVPTVSEWNELIENCDCVDANDVVIPDDAAGRTTVINGITVLRLRSKINGRYLMIAAGGSASGTRLANANVILYMWLSDLASDAMGRSCTLSPTYKQFLRNFDRFHGVPIRPVWRPDAG